MKFTLMDKWKDIDFGGSGLVGTFFMPSDKLAELLGAQPMIVDGPRIKQRYLLKFEDGTLATIFKDVTCKENEWCVGGFGQYDKKTKENLSFRAVKNLLNL